MTPSNPRLLVRHDGTTAQELAQEHGVLTRQMAGLQRRVGEQMRAQALQVLALQEEVLNLRAQLVVARTCMLWGLGLAGVARPLVRRGRAAVQAQAAQDMAEASAVICQTGCVGHAHPWLEGDGQCRRTGAACAQLTAGAEADDAGQAR
ncbi:hypothetical protein [Hydrogenophaga sp.]|uniref:hypothetical protein n=1 Tax=Hydrogenophaga sp. TaxID=1904254 RepID=UPI0026286D56|nr:hypothetical protein [Hydrogenophaga sp.]MCW5654754.1 hypothetical protein [Hydrogenophaga sp.]